METANRVREALAVGVDADGAVDVTWTELGGNASLPDALDSVDLRLPPLSYLLESGAAAGEASFGGADVRFERGAPTLLALPFRASVVDVVATTAATGHGQRGHSHCHHGRVTIVVAQYVSKRATRRQQKHHW